ncbi:2-oxoglutarate oxidoreductase subunit KorA [subsurface metagenome]|jgi:2-oxoglutarate ferredoxin oxidoreductase subunit alpha
MYKLDNKKNYPGKDKQLISLVICGEAGHGIQTVEVLLTRIFKLGGLNVFATKEYMSRVRGGSNSTQIIISSKKVLAPLNRIDILIPLDHSALPHLKERISKDSIILGEKEKVFSRQEILDVPFSRVAKEIGNPIFANIVAVGIIAAIFRIKQQIPLECIRKYFSTKGEKITQGNIAAIKRGYELAFDLIKKGSLAQLSIPVPDFSQDIQEEILLNGAEAVSLGAIFGGCNFISAYPMSPSTGVLIFLSQHAEEFNIIAEQAEDEISAINLALGAWYAGARGMVTTSGGGLALMEEGVSLAGMLEMPVVIHLAQRPGPATGLPTRTEQGDLELALYSGHGEFPRIIYAPGGIQDLFYLTQRAFNLADKFQIPVFVLTDQYLMDSYYNTMEFKLTKMDIERYTRKTKKNYKRYQLNKNGISDRGIPGWGAGLVLVDSDEHDEHGRITEDLSLRTRMVDKRLWKLKAIKEETISPELVGNKEYEVLIVSWGSTYYIVKEALENLKDHGVSLLHFKQVYPLPSETEDYLKKAKKVIVVENNATSQFSKLLKLYTGIEVEHKILKYNGLPFFVDELIGKLEKVI